MDCNSREFLGWHLSRSGRSKTAESALEQALIARFGTLGRVPKSFLLRSDNGLVFTSHSYTALVRGYGLRQEFITPHSPEQNGMVERQIRTPKEQCLHRHRFETLQHASRVISDWVSFYNIRRSHQALSMKTAAEAMNLRTGSVEGNFTWNSTDTSSLPLPAAVTGDSKYVSPNLRITQAASTLTPTAVHNRHRRASILSCIGPKLFFAQFRSVWITGLQAPSPGGNFRGARRIPAERALAVSAVLRAASRPALET